MSLRRKYHRWAHGNPSVAETIEFIQIAHVGQTDWHGIDYFHHPVAVMTIARSLPPYAGFTWRQKLVTDLTALLHDVIEDTPATHADLLTFGFNLEVADNVQTLTRAPASDYLDKIRGMVASGNRIVMLVKLADNIHNTLSERRNGLSAQQLNILQDMIRKRYAPSMAILREGLKISD